MQCAHCRAEFHPQEDHFALGRDEDGAWEVVRLVCAGCKKMSLYLVGGLRGLTNTQRGETYIQNPHTQRMIRPRGSQRPPCPSEVTDKDLAQDYAEACLVLPDSPKASAALSRRCLQHLLRTKAGVKHSDLSREIQQILDSKALPSAIAESLDAIRNVGNFAAHPIKSNSTGEIVAVEPGEAEWNLETLEMLFDLYFVQPARIKAKRDALNQKLMDAKKPPLK